VHVLEIGIKTPRVAVVREREEERRRGRTAVRVRVVDREGQLIGLL